MIEQSNDLTESLNDLGKMLKDPEKYFEDNPIKEDWQDPPKIPTKAEFEESMKRKTDILTQMKIYTTIAEAVHRSKKESKKQPDYEFVTNWQKHRKQEEIIAEKLRKVGFIVNTQSNTEKWNSHNEPQKTIHHSFDGFYLEEIPKTEKPKSIEQFLINENGDIRNPEELIKEYLEKEAPETPDFEELTEGLDETQKKMIKEFLESEDLKCDDIKEINESEHWDGYPVLEIDIYNKEYEMMESESLAEKLAFEMIDQDDEMKYFYTEAIKAETIDPTQTSFNDYIEQVKNDGWQYQLCRYDHSHEETKTGFVYWRSN